MILSIESSCDDSSIALTNIDTKKLVFHKKISQITHTNYGGVVPEIAAREHAIALPKILEDIKNHLLDVRAISVTHMPGLVVTLLEGITMAKALSSSLGVPLIGVNHLYGHIYSLFIEKEAILPQVVLLVSGGHTALFEVRGFEDIALVGSSLDDSIGESFDKVAKMLGLGYPGGERVENIAKNANENAFNFPKPLKHIKGVSFSYSGLKNAVRLQIQKSIDASTLEQDKADICASFQKSATMHLVDKIEPYLRHSDIKNFAVVGGVSSNKYIRGKFLRICQKYDKTLFLPKSEFCSDNAAMIGRFALELYENNKFTHHSKLDAHSRFL